MNFKLFEKLIFIKIIGWNVPCENCNVKTLLVLNFHKKNRYEQNLKTKKSCLIHKALISVLFYRLITFKKYAPTSLPQSLKWGARWILSENQCDFFLCLLKFFYFKESIWKQLSQLKTKTKPKKIGTSIIWKKKKKPTWKSMKSHWKANSTQKTWKFWFLVKHNSFSKPKSSLMFLCLTVLSEI